MEAFVLLPAIPILVLSLVGCTHLWRLINHGSTGRRVAGWLLFIPGVLFTLATLFVIISILTHKEKLELTAPPERPAVGNLPGKLP